MHAYAVLQALIKQQACAVSTSFSALQQPLLRVVHVPSCLICPAAAVAVPLLQVADQRNHATHFPPWHVNMPCLGLDDISCML
jgi:hypothetical protein